MAAIINGLRFLPMTTSSVGIVKRTDLISMAGISSNIVAKMGRNEYVSMESLEKVCRALKCDISDIVEFVTEESTGEH